MAFKRFDRNKDNKVSADEIPEVAPEPIKRMFKRADKNADGVVTAEELSESLGQFRRPSADGKRSWNGRRFGSDRAMPSSQTVEGDMLTPAYYQSGPTDSFRKELDRFLVFVRQERFHHPLQDKSGQIADFYVPVFGTFGIGKGPSGTTGHHPAIDLRVGDGETKVKLYAAHDGIVRTVRGAPKYRHYLSITKNIEDDDRQVIGKLVTLYGHVDLDLDEADSSSIDGRQVRQGDLVSRHLYSGTRGGPHLHFEIRYYRKDDAGTETFYGDPATSGSADLTEPSARPWSYGSWNADVGYGFGNPKHHGLTLANQAQRPWRTRSPQQRWPKQR